MENRMMNKNEVLQRIDAVCKNLDGGITVSDVRSAGNLAGCFAILQETLAFCSAVKGRASMWRSFPWTAFAAIAKRRYMEMPTVIRKNTRCCAKMRWHIPLGEKTAV